MSRPGRRPAHRGFLNSRPFRRQTPSVRTPAGPEPCRPTAGLFAGVVEISSTYLILLDKTRFLR
jgi:hypothetical protein